MGLDNFWDDILIFMHMRFHKIFNWFFVELIGILTFINICLLKNNGIKERISFYCASNNCGREESIFKVSVGSNFPQLVFCICKNWKDPTKAVEGLGTI